MMQCTASWFELIWRGRYPIRLTILRGLALIALAVVGAPANATMPSWQRATAVDRTELLSAGRKYLSPNDADQIERAIDAVSPQYKPRDNDAARSSYVALKNQTFIRDLLAIVTRCLARGERASVDEFFSAVNQGQLIRGYGQYHLLRGGYGGPMVIELSTQRSAQGMIELVVWYRLVHPTVIDGTRRDGPRFTYGTGVRAP